MWQHGTQGFLSCTLWRKRMFGSAVVDLRTFLGTASDTGAHLKKTNRNALLKGAEPFSLLVPALPKKVSRIARMVGDQPALTCQFGSLACWHGL
jgi:hypothetical protein